MRWAGLLVCCAAAYRLVGTPLQGVATVAAAASVACTAFAVLAPGVAASRIVTGFQHVLAALGGFFWFVSIAIR